MSLGHLERLHDTIERPDGDTLDYWWIYAAPAEADGSRPTPDTEFVPYHASHEGISCVDDVARIAVAYLSHYELARDEHSRKRARQALDFVMYMQESDGTFLNFVTDPRMNEVVFGDPDPDVVDGITVDGTGTSVASLSFWSSRACWALGEAYTTFVEEDPHYCDRLRDHLASYLDALEADPLTRYQEYEQVRGREVPAWLPGGTTYIAAPAVLGLAAYCRAGDDERARSALRAIATGIHECRSGDAVEYPFGAHLSTPHGMPWHTWGLRQSAALARAGDVLDEPTFVESARREVTALHSLHATSDAQIASFGPAPLPYHQLSYGTDALVQGCTELWRATDEAVFARMGAHLASWYCGTNVRGAAMWDQSAGRGYDGIYQDAVDWNAGAESTVAAVRTMLDLERYPGSSPTEQTVDVVDDRSCVIADAARGKMDERATRLDPDGVDAVFFGGRVVKIFNDGLLRVDPPLDAGEYRPALVVNRTIAPESTCHVRIGEQQRTADIGGAEESHYELVALDPVDVAADETVAVTYRGARDRSARVDVLVFHPAVAWRTIRIGENRVGAIARSVVDDRRSISIPLPGPEAWPLAVNRLDSVGQVSNGDDGVVDERDDTGQVTVPVEPRGVTLVESLPLSDE